MSKLKLGEISSQNLQYLRIANITSFVIFNGFVLATTNIEMILIMLALTILLTFLNFYYSFFRDKKFKAKLLALEEEERKKSNNNNGV